MRLLSPVLLLTLPVLAGEDFALDEGYGEAVSATVVLEQDNVKPQPDMRKNREVKIPADQPKRRKVTMVFEVTREKGEPCLVPLLQHQGALEFWILKGGQAKALRTTLPQEPCFVKLTGDRVLEKWYTGGFSVKSEHGRLYSFYPDRPVWVKTAAEMGELRARLAAEREAAEAARAAGRLPEALGHLKAAQELEADWPKDASPAAAKTRLTLEALLRLEAGASAFPDEKAHADFLLSVIEGIPVSRFDFDPTARMRELLLDQMRSASPAVAGRMEHQLLLWFRERYRDRSSDTACLDLAEELSLVGSRASVLPMDDYYKAKVLPGPWKDELKRRFGEYVEAIRARAKAQTP